MCSEKANVSSQTSRPQPEIRERLNVYKGKVLGVRLSAESQVADRAIPDFRILITLFECSVPGESNLLIHDIWTQCPNTANSVLYKVYSDLVSFFPQVPRVIW
jgi:hypothetical protein